MVGGERAEIGEVPSIVSNNFFVAFVLKLVIIVDSFEEAVRYKVEDYDT